MDEVKGESAGRTTLGTFYFVMYVGLTACAMLEKQDRMPIQED